MARTRHRKSLKHPPHKLRNPNTLLTWNDIRRLSHGNGWWQPLTLYYTVHIFLGLLMVDKREGLRDNEFILTGYRPAFLSRGGPAPASFSDEAALWSIFALHNETANIWIQLLAALCFTASLSYYTSAAAVRSRYPEDDRLAVNLYQLCASTAAILAAVRHTFSDHSPGMRHAGHDLEHAGIVLLAWATGTSATYFAYYCHAALRTAYLALHTLSGLACGAILAVALRRNNTKHQFPRAEYRRRLGLYCLLTSTLTAPVIHGLALFGYDGLHARMDLTSFFALLLAGGAGLAMSAARVPERRWLPGTFDLLGHSHNCMHVLVLAGALVRLCGLLDTAERWRDDENRAALYTCNQV